MKFFLLIACISALSLYANITQKLYTLYQAGNYQEACNVGRLSFSEMQHNENFVSLYAFSCLKSDQIDRLNGPIMALNQSVEARTNGAYFAMLLMQKKLLMQAVYDNKEFGNLIFPTSSHVISKIFNYYRKDPQRNSPIKTYTDSSNTRLSYKLYPADSNGRKTIAIDEFYDNILTMHHLYN